MLRHMTTIAQLAAASLALACAPPAPPRSHDGNTARPPDTGDAGATPDTARSRIRIIVGPRVFTATVRAGATATAFTSMLPLTATMTELNGNEKYVRLAEDLPRQAVNPGTIQAGDVMLYGDSTVVLFYETFSTSYRYTPIARVDDASGLAAALGTGAVTVTFER
jgi:hypothetical protein